MMRSFNSFSVDAEVTGLYITTDDNHWLISIDIRFRLLRIAYHWDSFLMEGILSMYHTCGKRLPMTMIHVSKICILDLIYGLQSKVATRSIIIFLQSFMITLIYRMLTKMKWRNLRQKDVIF